MPEEYRARTTTDDAEKSFLILPGQKHYEQQFDTIYSARLNQLRPALMENAQKAWGKRKAPHVPRVLDVVKGQQCYIIGTVYMDMPLKANVMEDIAQDHGLATIPLQTKRTSDRDATMLEDESGRVGLVGDFLKSESLVTGVNIAVLGAEGPTGEFEVEEVLYPGLAPPAHIPNRTPNESSYCAFLSGLRFGETVSTNPTPVTPEGRSSRNDSMVSVSLFLDWLCGEGGSENDRSLAQRVSRVIIAGDSLAASAVEEDKASLKTPSSTSTSLRQVVLNLGETFQEIARTVPIHVLPGASDPTGSALPQQPMPLWLFGIQTGQPAENTEALVMESNPTWIHSNGRSILVHAGQPINDIYMHSTETDRMCMVRNTLKWRHLAPTAPDTLWSYPYEGQDPFVLDRTPDLYVVGNQPEFRTEMVGPTRVVLLPQFSTAATVVLVDTATLEVETIEFGV